MCWYRGKIIAIIVLLLSGVWTSLGSAQEESFGESLADRISIIRDSVLGKNSSAQSPPQKKSPSNSPAEVAKKRSTSKSEKPASKRRPGSMPQRVASRANRPAKTSQTSLVLPKVDLGALLPNNLFGQKKEKKTGPSNVFKYPGEPEQAPPVTRVGSASKPRARSTNVKKSPANTRKSPSQRRKNELEAALADLLPQQPSQQKKESSKQIVEKKKNSEPVRIAIQSKAKVQKKTSAKKGLDLREALLGTGVQEETTETPDTQIAATSEEPKQAPQKSTPVVEIEVAESTPPATRQMIVEPVVIVPEEKEEPIATATTPNEEASLEEDDTFFALIPEDDISTESPEDIASIADIPEPNAFEQKPLNMEDQDTFVEVEMPLKDESQPAEELLSVQEDDQANLVQEEYLPVNPQSSDESTVVDPFDRAAEEAFVSPTDDRESMREDIVSIPHVEEDRVVKSAMLPVIVSHVEGPRSIIVGEEATYQVTLENQSDTAARKLSSVIRIPEWADVIGAMTTSGTVLKSEPDAQDGSLVWKLDHLTGNSSETLRLRIIPRSGRPLQLGIEWSQAPVRAKTLVQVQEPKLEMAISGPSEVSLGVPQRYKLLLRNPGTAPSRNVVISLIPPGGNSQSVATQNIGDLEPHELKEIEVELTAREGGQLKMEATASAEGGLTAETVKNVICRGAKLEIDWRGPEKKYAGTVAAYYFRISNTGSASSDTLEVQVKLPQDTKFVAASDGHTYNSATRVVSWKLASIEIDEQQFLQVRCQLERPGENEFEIVAESRERDAQEIKRFHTEVVALADLNLDVSDPPGPAVVGETVVYEIRIRNNGTSAAENVSIIGLFSEGIDPTSVEGGQVAIRDGRVTFKPISMLPPEHEIRFRIQAVATQPGTHIFRAEAICRELDIKQAVEETTRFLEEGEFWQEANSSFSAESRDRLKR